jgi:hypothetical protein
MARLDLWVMAVQRTPSRHAPLRVLFAATRPFTEGLRRALHVRAELFAIQQTEVAAMTVLQILGIVGLVVFGLLLAATLFGLIDWSDK